MRDIVSGLVSGVVGTAVIILILFVADAVTAFTLRPFGSLAVFVGEASQPVVGFLLFAAIGVLAWPYLFLSFVEFFPGRSAPVRGLVFGAVLWIGFVIAFSPPVGFGALVVYLLATLVAHLAYGFTLGSVFERFADREAKAATV